MPKIFKISLMVICFIIGIFFFHYIALSPSYSWVKTSLKDLGIVIPPHINLTDFYRTYGQRMLGNSNLKIISREEWGADNFQDLTSQTFCQTQFCIEEDYDPHTSF